MAFFFPLRPLLRGWLVSGVGWGLFALTLSWQISLATSLPWLGVLGFAGRGCLVWALVTPLIFRLVTRLPIERERWMVAVPVHLVVGTAMIIALGFVGPRPPRKAPGPGFHPPSLGWLILSPHLPVYLALLGAAHALSFYRRARERELRAVELSASLAEARLRALQMQIQPHFLFNSLNALAALIPRDPVAADAMLESLSGFLRLTFESSGEAEVPLRRELEYVERYLQIEEVRFGDRLAFAIEAGPETHAALVPTLLLQPLVENAVRHGIEPRSRPGRVVVRALREGDALRLIVHDDGVGMAAGPREGVGLANTRERLRELYGGAGSMALTADGGTGVEIRIPFHTSA